MTTTLTTHEDFIHGVRDIVTSLADLTDVCHVIYLAILEICTTLEVYKVFNQSTKEIVPCPAPSNH